MSVIVLLRKYDAKTKERSFASSMIREEVCIRAIV